MRNKIHFKLNLVKLSAIQAKIIPNPAKLIPILNPEPYKQMFRIPYLVTFAFLLWLHFNAAPSFGFGDRHGAEPDWNVGVASTKITPDEPMWMAGYANRDRPAEGTRHELYAKALVLEDRNGKQALLVTADIRNFPKNISDRIRDRIQDDHGLTREQIILNGSHTHTGPLLYTERNYPYYIDDLTDYHREKVIQYSSRLEDVLVGLAGEALNNTEPARIYAGQGVSRFAVNRRNNPASTIDEVTELAGPVDHAVPVLRIENGNGDLKAILFGYACHPTTLNDYKWSGDWPGVASMELEKANPGATAFFFLGAAGDINPIPRRSPPLVEQYGREMAVAVQAVIEQPMRSLSSNLEMAYSEIDLLLNNPPVKEVLEKFAEETSGKERNWANFHLGQLEKNGTLPTSYPYPVQIWKIGDQPIVSLGGEVVVDYAFSIKRILGQHTFVMAYSNDVMSYIPTARILEEGGYEAISAQYIRTLPATWKPEIEIRILSEILNLAEQVGVPQHAVPVIDH